MDDSGRVPQEAETRAHAKGPVEVANAKRWSGGDRFILPWDKPQPRRQCGLCRSEEFLKKPKPEPTPKVPSKLPTPSDGREATDLFYRGINLSLGDNGVS